MPRLDIKQNPPLAPFVLIDTSVALAAFFAGHPKHTIAQQFLQYAAAETLVGAAQLVASDLMITEAAHVIIKTGLQADVANHVYGAALQTYIAAHGSGRSFNWEQLHKREPQSVQPHLSDVRRFRHDIDAIPVLVLQPHVIGDPGFQIAKRAIELMDLYSLLSADAYHLAVAQAIDCDMVVSLDADWLRADVDFSAVYQPVRYNREALRR